MLLLLLALLAVVLVACFCQGGLDNVWKALWTEQNRALIFELLKDGFILILPKVLEPQEERVPQSRKKHGWSPGVWAKFASVCLAVLMFSILLAPTVQNRVPIDDPSSSGSQKEGTESAAPTSSQGVGRDGSSAAPSAAPAGGKPDVSQTEEDEAQEGRFDLAEDGPVIMAGMLQAGITAYLSNPRKMSSEELNAHPDFSEDTRNANRYENGAALLDGAGLPDIQSNCYYKAISYREHADAYCQFSANQTVIANDYCGLALLAEQAADQEDFYREAMIWFERAYLSACREGAGQEEKDDILEQWRNLYTAFSRQEEFSHQETSEALLVAQAYGEAFLPEI